MSNYQKIWGAAFGIFLVISFGLLLYAGVTSEKREVILETINSLDTRKVRNITISPENPEWQINLTVDTLTITDTKTIHDIISALKQMKQKHVTKGAKRFWESYLVLSLDTSYHFNLKDDGKLSLKAYNTDEGLFIEMANTMSYETYSCQQLNPLLERLTKFKGPVGGHN